MVVGEAYDFSAGYLNGWLNDVESYMDDDTKVPLMSAYLISPCAMPWSRPQMLSAMMYAMYSTAVSWTVPEGPVFIPSPL